MTLKSDRIQGILKSLGPGLLWAGAAIGVSHLVQSTRAGANYGFALVWAVLLANLFKYPFFEYGPRYAAATGESLLEGYLRLGKWAMGVYLLLTFGVMFTIQAAVTIVTAGLAAHLFGIELTPLLWSGILLVICALILMLGRYPLLDKLMKVIIIVLTISTITAVILAISHGSSVKPDFKPPVVWNLAGISFLVALMGWMPSAFDISVWHSVWTLERKKQTGYAPKLKEALFDFNLGYIGTAFLALIFLTLGALTIYGTGEKIDPRGSVFASQLISIYTSNLGAWSYWVILIAAFTTMFSTTLTVTDAFPRVLRRSTELIFPKLKDNDTRWIYFTWMMIVCSGSMIILGFLAKSMRTMVDIATTLSFLTAPVLGYINFKVITSDQVPLEAQPPTWLRVLSWVGLIFLTGFSILFIIWRFGYYK
ncbi:MAG: Nramp family divalent metal transporter [Candidatus Electryonea clarkiae]|nr:Nramp family divalent metal transporter [Candidatus Electryonea clarkiae]MDP8285572.1 Nramp family divalent metal transporter [Candidatus Electryonea clarkiae]